MAFPVLRKNDHNDAVEGLQSGLHRALHAKGLPHKNNREGHYGSLTVEDANRFEHAYGVRPVSGAFFDAVSWRKLEPFLSQWDRNQIKHHQDAKALALAEAEAAIGGSEARAKLAITALEFYEKKRATYVYCGPPARPTCPARPMPSGLYVPEAKDHLDCSSMVTLVYKEAGLPDPNGAGYNGSGWTGSLVLRGAWTSTPKAGDLAFYGPSTSSTTHTAIHVDGFRVVSFGSTPISLWATYRYRSDYLGSKSYV